MKNKIKTWTLNEINYIKNNFNGRNMKEIASYLKRSESSIRSKMWVLKIKKKEPVFSAYIGDEYIATGTISELSKLTGYSRSTIMTAKAPSYMRRIENAKRSKRPLIVVEAAEGAA